MSTDVREELAKTVNQVLEDHGNPRGRVQMQAAAGMMNEVLNLMATKEHGSVLSPGSECAKMAADMLAKQLPGIKSIQFIDNGGDKGGDGLINTKDRIVVKSTVAAKAEIEVLPGFSIDGVVGKVVDKSYAVKPYHEVEHKSEVAPQKYTTQIVDKTDNPALNQKLQEGLDNAAKLATGKMDERTFQDWYQGATLKCGTIQLNHFAASLKENLIANGHKVQDSKLGPAFMSVDGHAIRPWGQ